MVPHAERTSLAATSPKHTNFKLYSLKLIYIELREFPLVWYLACICVAKMTGWQQKRIYIERTHIYIATGRWCPIPLKGDNLKFIQLPTAFKIILPWFNSRFMQRQWRGFSQYNNSSIAMSNKKATPPTSCNCVVLWSSNILNISRPVSSNNYQCVVFISLILLKPLGM